MIREKLSLKRETVAVFPIGTKNVVRDAHLVVIVDVQGDKDIKESLQHG